MDYSDQVQVIYRRWQALRSERSSWMSHWQELAKYLTPRAGRFLETTSAGNQPDRGEKKHQHIFDNSPLRTMDVLAAGLMAGMTSPARPWFRLDIGDPGLSKKHAVRVWLSQVEDLMRDVFSHSNTYRVYRRHYEELGIFGTSASIQLPDFHDVVRHYPLTIGEYAIGLNSREQVDTIYRQFEMTVEQMVGAFGLKNCSRPVQDMYNASNYTKWLPVLHAIEPRRDAVPGKLGAENMPWKSCYIESGSETKGFLRESGFKRFPALVPRWKVNGHDFYGESPMMRALGDIKQLQQEQYRKSQAIDYMTQPPLQVPASLAEAFQRQPGAVNVVDQIGQGVKSAWDVDLNLQYLLTDIMDVRQRISKAGYEDLFLMFTMESPGIQPKTAQEISAKQEEKLLMIGPVLENLNDELLVPDIEQKFEFLLEAGLIPPAPPELHGQALVIKFVSTLAQAQKLIGLNSLDRMIGTIVNLAAIKPEALDKLDTDEVIDTYSDALGINPDMIIGNDQVALIRKQREAQQAKIAAAQAAPDVAKTAKTLGDTNIQGAGAALAALQSLGGTP